MAVKAKKEKNPNLYRWNARKLEDARKNVTAIENTVANKLQESKLIERMESMQIEDIKTEFADILNSKTTKIKSTTRRKYLNDLENTKGRADLQWFIVNFQLAGDGLALH
jgi:hypothetical protein